MYQALYRKYRPILFEDVCGQEHITSVLKTQLQKGRVSHAYMFCGSRGTGKTTCAKILAKAVNCENLQNGEPCNACDSCRAINEERIMDVVEMDAASNNGVDHIRRLCDEVQFLPSEAKKRVYIIDEVHMLSTSAFNALLKTIEEPPSHVLFILATTEVEDIPATILSRCQRFDFKRIAPQIVEKRLLKIAQTEKISLSEDAAAVIARLCDGAMRDALSLLEACQGYEGEITADRIRSILGLGSREAVIALAHAIAQQDIGRCLQIVSEIFEQMSDFKEVIASLIAIYRDLLVIRSVPEFEPFVDAYGDERKELTEIASVLSVETILFQAKLLEAFYVSYDRIASGKKSSAEILMIRLCREDLSESSEALLSRIAKLENALSSGVVPKGQMEAEKTIPAKPAQKFHAEPQPEMKNSQKDAQPKRFAASVKLKNLLQNEQFLKPWLPQIEFVKEGDVLHLQTGSFAKGILVQTNAQDLILNAAKQVDPEIRSLVLEEKQEKNQTDPVGLEGL